MWHGIVILYTYSMAKSENNHIRKPICRTGVTTCCTWQRREAPHLLTRRTTSTQGAWNTTTGKKYSIRHQWVTTTLLNSSFHTPACAHNWTRCSLQFCTRGSQIKIPNSSAGDPQACTRPTYGVPGPITLSSTILHWALPLMILVPDSRHFRPHQNKRVSNIASRCPKRLTSDKAHAGHVQCTCHRAQRRWCTLCTISSRRGWNTGQNAKRKMYDGCRGISTHNRLEEEIKTRLVTYVVGSNVKVTHLAQHNVVTHNTVLWGWCNSRSQLVTHSRHRGIIFFVSAHT